MSPLRRIVGSPVAASLWSAALGAALWFAPATLAARVHGFTWDALRPGLQLANFAEHRINHLWTRYRRDELQRLRGELERLESQLDLEQQRTRRLTAQLLAAREPTTTSVDQIASASERLFLPAVIDAAVLGETLSQSWRQGAVVNQGWQNGLRESALVLHSTKPLIDRGEPDQLSAEDMLLLGRSVVGKVDAVGRWTSTFIPITDVEFRGRAQLVRQSDDGPQWGAVGLLHGDGTRCRLEGVSGNESVRVGDLVMTAERDAALGATLSYGTVVAAHLGLDDREWQIVVEPPRQPTAVRQVQVLRTALNPARLWAH